MQNETTILLTAIQEAGLAIKNMQQTGFETAYKENDDPLTSADLLANQILQKYLHDSFPHYGWLSEETADDLSRLNCQRVWIVDPIDGTREFVKGIPEYALSVALVEQGIPILSAVFNPATNELFHACKNQGAWLNGQPITCLKTPNEIMTILASRTEMAAGKWANFIVSNNVQAIGSIAYKLGLVAAGKAEATFSLGPKHEWDIAAGVLLVQEAGGIVKDKFRHDFLFNREDVLANSIVAVAMNAYETIQGQIEKIIVSSHYS